MSRLTQIKDEYAKDKGFLSWNNLMNVIGLKVLCQHENEVMKLYAAECCKATLELAKENTICFINSDDCGRIETEDYYNILEFIESKNNIVLL